MDDIVNAFDGISYQKGAAVLTMFESWLGAETFRAGVRRYLNTHSNGTATSRDFLAAVEAASRPGVAAAFSTFLEQAGVPVVEVSLDCGEGGAKCPCRRNGHADRNSDPGDTWQAGLVRGGADARAPARARSDRPRRSRRRPRRPAWSSPTTGDGLPRAIPRRSPAEVLAVADTELSVRARELIRTSTPAETSDPDGGTPPSAALRGDSAAGGRSEARPVHAIREDLVPRKRSRIKTTPLCPGVRGAARELGFAEKRARTAPRA